MAGLGILAALSCYTLRAADVAAILGSWAVPAVALLHLVEEAGCAGAWRNVVAPPRPGFWPFFRARWIRASVVSLTPISGVGGALAAVRIVGLGGLQTEVAIASLVIDSTVEMITQVVFTALGLGALSIAMPQQRMLGWVLPGLLFAGLSAAGFVAAQRLGAFRLVEAGLRRLAGRWPRMLPLAQAKVHDRLISLYGRRAAVFRSGCIHLGCWLLGAAEIWLTLAALGDAVTLDRCLIIESLAMAARSAGFFVPAALGIQEVAFVVVCGLVGLPAEAAVSIAIVKRLRDLVLGLPGLALWQWQERRLLQRRRLAGKQG